MPKTKNKKLPHFKEILKIISKNQKSLPRSSNYWKTDLNIVNGLHEILVKDTDESLQNWWKERGEYSSTEVSRFKADNQTRFIDMNIINWYSQNLNLNEQVERLKKNINDFKPAPDFVDEVTSKSIFDYLNNNIDTVSSFIIERLESYLLLKDYAGFFGVVLFYLAADMPDLQEKTYSYKNIIGTERTFLNDLFDDLDKGKLYDYYNYSVSYYPNIDGKYIKSVNKVSYLSHIKNIVKFDKPHIEYN
ncbi:hypothetical protein MKL26_02890 [Streptococcus suis]|nr:hypothetical protein [Streptococcus suis]